MQYRPEIDGLRALAVVPVVFFHAGIDFLSGGFIGVDIFFVISGYLIAFLLLEEKSKDQFSLGHFYERRIRRILPALFSVILVTSVFAWFWMLPSQMLEYSQSLIAVLILISNIFFYFKSGYFSSSIEEKPLVHTWSLAVEEQFYILFPLLMFCSWAFLKKNLTWFMLVCIGLSYACSEYLSRTYPDLSFYIMPTRAWELLLGALCASYIFNRKRLHSSNFLAILGFVFIFTSILFLHEGLPHPSFYTIPAVVGTCLIILYSDNTVVGRVLSYRPVVLIGLISYSAYLWHQPLLAMARVKSLEDPHFLVLVALAILSFLLAGMSYRYIESPFRKKVAGEYRISLQITVLSLGIAASLIGLAGVAGHVTGGYAKRFTIPDHIAQSIERNTSAYACFDLHYPHESEKWGCNLGADQPEKDYDFLVWGDSHLLVTHSSFSEAATNANKKGFYVGIRQCTPFLGIHALRYDQTERNCNKLNQRVFDFVKTHNIPKLILVSRWSYYISGGYDGEHFSYIGLTPHDEKTPEKSKEAYLYGLEKTLAAYSDIGVEVVVMEQVPQQKYHPEEIYYLAYSGKDSNKNLEKISVDKTEHIMMQSAAMEQFYLQQKTYPNLKILEITDVFCDDVCLVGDDNASFYYDEDHLSITGAKKLVPIIEKTLY